MTFTNRGEREEERERLLSHTQSWTKAKQRWWRTRFSPPWPCLNWLTSWPSALAIIEINLQMKPARTFEIFMKFNKLIKVKLHKWIVSPRAVIHQLICGVWLKLWVQFNMCKLSWKSTRCDCLKITRKAITVFKIYQFLHWVLLWGKGKGQKDLLAYLQSERTWKSLQFLLYTVGLLPFWFVSFEIFSVDEQNS